VHALGAEGADKTGGLDAVDFISHLRQASDVAAVPIGRDVVVIGGGMTAIDAAIQAKLLGALNVTLVYRRGRDRMNASVFEQDLAASNGVRIVTHATPVAVIGNGAVREIEFEYVDDQMNGTGQTLRLPADQVFKAIGQTLQGDALPTLEARKIKVDGTGRTSVDGVWAGGDCASGGDDLTVTAVAEGRDAAMDIHMVLMG
jgi:dihydropyrimidine dehydrogenase (NAD+) subunit PreT